MKQTAINQNPGLSYLDDVTGTGYFAAGCANKGDFIGIVSWCFSVD